MRLLILYLKHLSLHVASIVNNWWAPLGVLRLYTVSCKALRHGIYTLHYKSSPPVFLKGCKKIKRCISYRQVETYGILDFILRPITILSIWSRNLFILAQPLPPKMMSVWRSSAGSLLPIVNFLAEISLVGVN